MYVMFSMEFNACFSTLYLMATNFRLSGMATELQHTINLSTRASSEHFFAYRLRLKNHSKSDFCKLRCSMDRLQQKLPNVQSMKNTMLMHEEIFNQQV